MVKGRDEGRKVRKKRKNGIIKDGMQQGKMDGKNEKH